MPPAQSSPPTTTATTSSVRADWWRMKPQVQVIGLIGCLFTTEVVENAKGVGEYERGQSTHSNKIGLHGEAEWVDLVGNCEGAVR